MQFKKRSMVTLALGVMLFVVDSAAEKFEAYLRISGIAGRVKINASATNWTQVRGMPDPSELLSDSSKLGESRAERVETSDFSITKSLDPASPKLALECTKGTHIKEVELELCRAGGDKQPFFRIRMFGVKIAAIEKAGGGKLERVRFTYSRIKWEPVLPKRKIYKIKKQ